MRLLLDEHLDPALAVELRARGHDVRTVVEDVALKGRGDAELLDHAAARGLVIATYDARDFLRLIDEREHTSRPVHGILVISARSFPSGSRGHGRLLRALLAVLERHRSNAPLPTRVVWLAPAAGEKSGL